MRKVYKRGIVAAVLGLLTLAGTAARADEGADAKRAVEGFVAGWKSGDEKAIKATLVIPAGREKEVGAVVDSIAAISRLQKAATAKYGESAAEYFADASGQFEARMKAIKEGPVKVMGESAILTIPPDEKAKTKGGTIILVKSGGIWKIDAASLFNMTPENAKQTAELAAAAEKLTPIANDIAKEIGKGTFAAATDAYTAFYTRYTAALKELDAGPATKPGATTTH